MTETVLGALGLLVLAGADELRGAVWTAFAEGVAFRCDREALDLSLFLGGGVEVLGFDFEDRPWHQVLVERVERLEPGGEGTNLLPRHSGQLAVGCAGACDRAAGGGGSDEEAVGVAEHALASGVVEETHRGGEEEASSCGDQGGDDRVEPWAPTPPTPTATTPVPRLVSNGPSRTCPRQRRRPRHFRVSLA